MREQRAYTTFEAAKICHVTHHSIKNWIKQGLIRASRTPGGHYRILEEDLDAFREKYDMFPPRRTSGKRRIMIVDDEQDALDLMERIHALFNGSLRARPSISRTPLTPGWRSASFWPRHSQSPQMRKPYLPSRRQRYPQRQGKVHALTCLLTSSRSQNATAGKSPRSVWLMHEAERWCQAAPKPTPT